MTKHAAPKMNGQDKSAEEKVFSIHNFYLKDVSFEAPHTPHIFREEWRPDVDFDIQLGSQVLSPEEGLYEVLIHLTVTVRLKKPEKPAFLVELKQAGIFTLKGFEESAIKHLLATECPYHLFPFVRETVTNLAQRGGFPPLLLPPINFEALYAKHLEKEKEGGGKSGNLEQPLTQA